MNALRTVAVGQFPIEKMPGDGFGTPLSFEHRGPGGQVWVGLGLAYGIFIGHNPPFCYAMQQVTLEEDPNWTTYSFDVEGTVPQDALAGRLVDAQRFISDSEPVVGQQPPNPWGVNNWDDEVYSIGGVPPEYVLIQDTLYPYAYVYDGDVQVTTVTYRTDPFSPSGYNAERLAQALKDQVEAEGARVIGLKVWVDTTPLLWTDIRVEVTLIPPEGVSVAFWQALILIIAVALAAIGIIIALTVFSDHVYRFFKHEPLSEEIKLTWSRETLISVIGDFEEKLDITPKTPEELAAMSDEKLRTYCNEMAEVIAPPGGIPWWAWVAGGTTVLGVGTLVYATRKKPKK